jgi:hypothetical protein
MSCTSRFRHWIAVWPRSIVPVIGVRAAQVCVQYEPAAGSAAVRRKEWSNRSTVGFQLIVASIFLGPRQKSQIPPLATVGST